MHIDEFNHIIDYWITELNQYTFEQICAKPSDKSWSLGQLCMHLIENTDYYANQILICITNNDFMNEEAAAAAKNMFDNNDFPDKLIEGPTANALTMQPASKEQLHTDMLSLRIKMNEAAALMAKSNYKGKTKHPGLNYFSAGDWLQFAEMHFRHHLRQKTRIDIFLKQLSAKS
ncbi:DinB family protein [Pinibacter soli]|uniref:DinB family protein n=1 Tax=Pinibacter soli TaxID=3044211 RepID=A0ABT6RKP8_9BACT|nr:DinB family protein [Pinibacter soli]MDI3322412.1 DinB family protein [Pinibacter soli]